LNNVNITVEREQSVYMIDVDMNDRVFDIKWDSGAADTVISIGALDDSLSPEELVKFKVYCENKGKCKKQFISATGDVFYGYLVSAHNAVIGGALVQNFCYYIVLENKRDIALLGFDFIDRCKYTHEPHSDILITAVDLDGYGELEEAMDSDEILTYVDSFH